MTRQDHFKDRFLFSLTSATAVAVVAFLTRRAVETAWQRATGRSAPKPLGLLNPAGKRAGESTAAFLIERMPLLNRLQR